MRKKLGSPSSYMLLFASEFFSNAVFKRLLEKKIGEKAVEDLLPARSLGTRRQVSFSQVFD